MFSSPIRSWLGPPTSHHSNNTRSSTKNPSSIQRSSGVTLRNSSTGKRQLTQRTSCPITSTSRKAPSPLNGWRAPRRISATTCWIETLKMDMAIKLHFFGMSWFLTFRMRIEKGKRLSRVGGKVIHSFSVHSTSIFHLSLFPPTRQSCSTSANKPCYVISYMEDSSSAKKNVSSKKTLTSTTLLTTTLSVRTLLRMVNYVKHTLNS